ncbi:Peptidase M23 [uncultured Caudovirales phage]|uniref:Peptidase M23 n=1 Tax=uncultured Caudovirales phage TaxID=2100421 RepID=A0A6J5L6J9_9CAUD|nr:Peptidase M23 [uncultured Caudovirales phage]
MSYINTLAQYRMSDDWAGHLARGSAGGIDYAVGMNTPIPAPCDGYLENYPDNGNQFGNYIRFHHGDGFHDEYLHLNSFVGGGSYKQGQIIGYSGNTGNSTGPHIHWHLIDPNGRRVNPLDYLNNTPIPEDKVRKIMKVIQDKSNGAVYIVGLGFIHHVTPAEWPHVKWELGDPTVHTTTADLVAFCGTIGIPADKPAAVIPGKTWSLEHDLYALLAPAATAPVTPTKPTPKPKTTK